MAVIVRERAARTSVVHAPRRRGRLAPYVLVSPALICLLTFGVLPIIVAAVVSFTNMDLSGLGDFSKVHFIGLGNYTAMFEDSAFWQALRNTVFYILIGVPTLVVGSLAVAIALNQSSSRLFRALRAFYFLPAIMGIVAIALIWGYLYNTQFGLLNYLLSLVGIQPIEWLADPTVAKFSVALVAIWRGSGLNIIIYLAALQSIPPDYYEAASIDGAGEWRKVLSITIPLLRFAIFFVTITSLISWMQFFDEVYVLTGGGPVHATTSLSLYIYQQGFQDNEFGFASAASIVLFMLIAVVTAIQLRLKAFRND